LSRSSVTLYSPQIEAFVDMIGDKLVITNYHRQAAAKIFPRAQQALRLLLTTIGKQPPRSFRAPNKR